MVPHSAPPTASPTWAGPSVAADTGIFAALSQDGSRASGVILVYDAGDNSWRFGLLRADADGCPRTR